MAGETPCFTRPRGADTAGYELLTASRAEAEACYERHASDIAAVVIAARAMPADELRRFTERVRRSALDMPMIVVTAEDVREDVGLLWGRYGCAVLVEPFGAEQVFELVARLGSPVPAGRSHAAEADASQGIAPGCAPNGDSSCKHNRGRRS